MCVRDKKIRSLAIKPWIVATISYLFFGAILFYFHGEILGYLSPDGSGWWISFLQGLLWILVTVIVMTITTALSFVMALILSGIFQTEIAAEILRRNGLPVQTETETISEFSKMIIKSVTTESIKLLWILPLGTLLLILSLIPLLTIPAAVGGAWLLAYGSFDIVLDAWGTTALQRLSFAIRNGLTLVMFGLIMMACCIIPFGGLLLPPIASASAGTFCALHSQLLPKKTK